MPFREKCSYGEWCALLLPLALVVSHWQDSNPQPSEDNFGLVVIVLAIAMSIYSLVFGNKTLCELFF